MSIRISRWRAGSFRPSDNRLSERVRRKRIAGLRYAVEPLERRLLLSSVIVNTTADSTDAPGSGVVSLRDAVAVADSSAMPTTSTSPTLTQNLAQAATTTAVNAGPGGTSVYRTYGLPVNLIATVTPSGSGETGTVQFQIDGSNVGSPVALSDNYATYTTSTLGVGTHSIVAIYSGDSNFSSSTSPAFSDHVTQVGPWGISTLATFNKTNGGYYPDGGLTADASGNLYGTTENGGANNEGTVFELSGANHQTLTTLVNFNGTNGANPEAGLTIDASGNLYGTTPGGMYNDGTIFELSGTNHQTLTTLVSFNGTNGAGLFAGLTVDASGNLYGTTRYGGANNDGTVFELSGANHQTLTTIATFDGTNGADPVTLLTFDSAGNLYGTTWGGGANNDGTAFELSGINHQTLTTIATFDGTNGVLPDAGLTIDASGNLYGTTAGGVGDGPGTIFELSGTNHQTLTTLVNFSSPGGLIADTAGNLYGTTPWGGANGWGAVFELSGTNHQTLTWLASFSLIDGTASSGGALMIDAAGNLYGTSLGDYPYTLGMVAFEVTPDTAVTSSNATPTYGQSVTFTATVAPIGAGPTGTVQFQIDGSNAGSPVTLSGNTATYTTSTLSFGSHSIVAVYSGDGNFSGSTSPALTQSVAEAATTTTVTTSNDPATRFTKAGVTYGQPATFIAGVGPSSGSGETGAVQFQIDGSNVGSPVALIGNGATFTTSTLSAGTHSLVAVYSGDNNFSTSTSQAFTMVVNKAGPWSFSTLATFDNTNGAEPCAGLTSDAAGNLYGTTIEGGADNDGTVFELSGTHHQTLTTLVTFYGTNGEAPAGLTIDAAGNVFGTTSGGGANNDGTVFELSGTNHQTLTALVNFNGANGSFPYFSAGLTIDGAGNLYGTTANGGTNNDGTVFELSGTNHQTLTTLVSLNGTNGGGPDAGLTIDAAGNLYGMTSQGGANSDGTVFELSGIDYQTLTTLLNFNGTNGLPTDGLTIDAAGNLYGTTEGGGANNFGTVFELSGTNHETLTTLVNFGDGNGVYPQVGLTIDATGNLYGITLGGGANAGYNIGLGTVFEVSGTNRQTLTTLASFSFSNGAGHGGALTVGAGGDLYGTEDLGGNPTLNRGDGLGTVFELTPDIAVTSSNTVPSYGQPVTFTATTVTPEGVAGPTGTVQFHIDGSNVGSPAAISDNTATLSISTLTAGNHSIVAIYSGDANFSGSTSVAFCQSVAQATPTLSWTTPAAITYGTALSGAQLNATASVLGAFSYTPAAGTVVAGSQQLNVSFTPTDAIDYTSASGSVTLVVSIIVNTGTQSLPGGTGSGVQADIFSIITIGASAQLSLPKAPNQIVLEVPQSALSIVGTLDLGGNNMIVQGGGATGLTDISSLLKTGFNAGSGYWNGTTGIISSAASSDTTFLTTLGYRTGGSTFDGVNTTSSDVLVKYTYHGDANLDGTVNGVDYQQIDNGFGMHLTGWFNGDFNYDGVVDGSDYSLIDNAFNQMTATGASPLAIVAATHSADDTNAAGFPIALVTHSKPKFVGTSVALSQTGSLGVFNDGTAIDAWQANSSAGDLIDSANGSSGGDLLKEFRIRSRRISSPN